MFDEQHFDKLFISPDTLFPVYWFLFSFKDELFSNFEEKKTPTTCISTKKTRKIKKQLFIEEMSLNCSTLNLNHKEYKYYFLLLISQTFLYHFNLELKERF